MDSGSSFGVCIEGIDLSEGFTDGQQSAIEQALGCHGVIIFPRQQLTPRQLRNVAVQFRQPEVSVANCFQEADVPEVMILSNIVEDGIAIGLSDAGQDLHTNMSYSSMISFCNIFYAIEIPHRAGEPLLRGL